MWVENIYSTVDWDGMELLAVLIRHNQGPDWPDPVGVKFLSHPDDPLQVGLIKHATGHVVPRHFHNQNVRTVYHTQEVLIVHKGKILVEFYDSFCQPAGSRECGSGDVLWLIRGGHGITVLEDVEITEIKGGPYQGKDRDKTVF